MAKPNEDIIDGVSIDRSGVVHIDSKCEKPLCDLAIELQTDDVPVDVEHVVAALVMAVRDGKLERGVSLEAFDAESIGTVGRYVALLFKQHGGKVCDD